MWEGLASLGLSLPLSPPPCLLPPAGMDQLFSGVSQSLCFANRRQCVQAGPAPTCWWRGRVSGELFCWELLLGTLSVGLI